MLGALGGGKKSGTEVQIKAEVKLQLVAAAFRDLHLHARGEGCIKESEQKHWDREGIWDGEGWERCESSF